MKKTVSLILALILMLSALIVPAWAEGAPPSKHKKTGMLSMLSMSEEEYLSYLKVRQKLGDFLIRMGYSKDGSGTPGPAPNGNEPPAPGERPEGDVPPEGNKPPEGNMPPQGQEGGGNDEIIFYDSLDAILMALSAGDIDSIEIYQSVAKYLCAVNKELSIGMEYDMEKERNAFAESAFAGILGNDISFLMMESNTALLDEFNKAIAELKADGTLDTLVKEQITDLIDSGEINPVKMPVIEGAEKIKVAVTGALPPMDYVAADGTPSGFNTAVLAEISKRIGKNIELVVVDSIGRSTALASGNVDVVFWTRTNALGKELKGLDSAARDARWNEVLSSLDEKDRAELDKMKDSLPSLDKYVEADMPAGTVATDPYYSDVFVPVHLAEEDEGPMPEELKQIPAMREALSSFDTAHPEYKDAWNEILQAMHDVHYKLFSDVFANVQKKYQENSAAKRAEKNVPDEDAKEIDQIFQDMMNLVRRDFGVQILKAVRTVNLLSETRKLTWRPEEIKKTSAEPVTQEELQAVIDRFRAYQEAHPKYKEAESNIFKGLNDSLLEELTLAHEKSGKEMQEIIDGIFEKYKIPEEDRQTINEILQKMIQQINESFLAYAKNNTVVGPISFVKE